MSSFFAKLLGAIGSGAAILGACAVVVWPIWALATGSRRTYTALVGVLLLALAAAAFIHRRGKPRAGKK